MRISVKLFGTLRRLSLPDHTGEWSGVMENQSTLQDLMSVIGTTEREVQAATINGTISSMDTVLQDGDEIVLVTPMGGG